MANQPKKYTKFVATAATATLVASAIVPVASAASTFPDVADTNSHAESINALVEAGIINGYPDGTFKPNLTLKRGQVVKMLGKWAEAQGFKVPADYNTKARFTDLAADAADQELVKYAAVVKDAGIFLGDNGALNTSGNITRENMALVLDRAYKAVTGKSLVELAEGSQNVVVGDLAVAKAEAREEIQALRNLGISVVDNFKPKDIVTRAQFASFLNKTIQAVAPTPAEVTLQSVKATNAKTITVEFNKAVDSSKATFEVLRGAFKQTVTVKWAEDKKSVQLISSNNFQTGDYTVNVSGLSEKVLTGSVKFEAQKVASIEILSDIAVVKENPLTGLLTSTDSATVGYVVKDQYGTDITNTTSLTTNANTVTASNGTIKIQGASLTGKRLGDLVPVVLIHQASGVTATQTLKLSAAATIAKVEGTGVVNAKGETVSLTDATKSNSVFLTLKLTDQYGNVLNAADSTSALRESILVANQNPLVANVDNTITTQTINGKTEFVLKFNKVDADNNIEFRGGTADILFIAKANGEKFSYAVTVNETAASDSISIGQPEYAVAGEAVKFPITVSDKAGNLITDTKVLTDAVKGIKADNRAVAATNFEVKDGQVFFIIPAAQNTTTGFKTLILTTSTYKVGTLTYEVQAAAKPTAISGFKSGVIKTGVVKDLTWADLNVEDQYGRTMTKAALDALTAYDFRVLSVNGTTIERTGNKQVTAGSQNGSSSVQLALFKDGSEVANTRVNSTLRVTDGKEYDSFEISLASDKVQAIATSEDAAKLTVNGILDGGKVALDPSEYTASVVGVGTVTNGEISVDKEELKDNGNYPDAEYTLRVVINTTGEVLERKITVSAKAPSAQELFFTATEAGGTYSTATPITTAKLPTSGTVATGLVTGSGNDTVNYAIVDQYGNKSVVAGSAVTSVTVVPERVSDVTITNNGTKNATVALASGVDTAVVTVKVTIGSVTKDLKVTITE